MLSNLNHLIVAFTAFDLEHCWLNCVASH